MLASSLYEGIAYIEMGKDTGRLSGIFNKEIFATMTSIMILMQLTDNFGGPKSKLHQTNGLDDPGLNWENRAGSPINLISH